MIRRWFILGGLAAVLLGLMWSFYTEVVVYHPVQYVFKRTVKPAKAEQKAPGRFQPAWDARIAGKDLFSEMRGTVPPAPPVVKKPEAPTVDTTPPQLALSGIILNQFGEYIAYISKDGGPTKRVRKDDVFDGVLVLDIKPRRVTLMWNDEEIVLSMRQMKSKGNN